MTSPKGAHHPGADPPVMVSPARAVRGSKLSLFFSLLVLVPLVHQGPASSATPGAPEGARPPLHQRVAFGAWVDGMTNDPSRLARFEGMVRERTDIASYYWGYGDVFPGRTELEFADRGTRKVLLSWDMGPTRFAEWSSGLHDDYLDQIVAAARAYPHHVHVRPWPEMNGDWQTFQPTADGSRVHGGTHEEFVTAWRYLVDYFRDRGVDNLRWVFNPTVDTYEGTTPVRKIWPAAGYVDVLGIDGFNWGRDQSWGRWKGFGETFRPMYDVLTSLHPTAPVWICEVSSKEPRVDDGAPRDPRRSKAAWIRSALNTRAFPRLSALIWFHAEKERDWRVNSSRAALRSMRRLLG